MIIDLNYRLDLPDADVRSILSSKQWEDGLETMLRYDQVRFKQLARHVYSFNLSHLHQLIKTIRTRKAFEGFIECSIAHTPYA
jgi:inositol polyphosphate 5-phosphatase INPP5B/F